MNFFQLLLKLSSVSVLTSVIFLVTSMILGRIMEPQHFGEYSFLQSILMILVNVSSLSASLAISVFMYRSPINKLNRILNNTFFTVLPIFFFSCLIVILIISFNQGGLNFTYFWVLINVVMMSLCLIGIDYLRMKQDIRTYSFLFLVYSISIAFFSLLGYLLGHNVVYIYMASAFALIFPLFYTFKIISYTFTLDFNFQKKIKTYLWSLKYGIPVVSSTVVMSFLVVGDKIILGNFLSKTDLAEYSIAALIASTSLFIVNNFASAWGAFLFKKIPNLERLELREYYFKTMKWLVLGIPSMLILCLAQQLLYFLFFFDKYPGLNSTIFALTASYCLLGISKYFMGYLNYFNRNVLIFYSALFSSFVMFLCFKCIVDMSVFGMSISVFIAMLSLFISILYLTTKEVNKYAFK